jgi:hypothetical protein
MAYQCEETVEDYQEHHLQHLQHLSQETLFIDRTFSISVWKIYHKFYPFHVLLLFFIWLTWFKPIKDNQVFGKVDITIVKTVYDTHPWTRPYLKYSPFLTDEPRYGPNDFESEFFYVLLCKKIYQGLQDVEKIILNESIFKAFRVLLSDYVNQYPINPELQEQIVEIGYDPSRVQFTQPISKEWNMEPWVLDPSSRRIQSALMQHDPNLKFKPKKPKSPTRNIGFFNWW